MIEAEQHHSGDEQELVCKRIQNCPQLAALVVPSGNVAIHAIAQCRNKEAHQRQDAMGLRPRLGVVKHLKNKIGNEQNACDRDLVGSRHLECPPNLQENAAQSTLSAIGLCLADSQPRSANSRFSLTDSSSVLQLPAKLVAAWSAVHPCVITVGSGTGYARSFCK